VVVEAGAFVDVGTVSVNPAADLCTRDVTVIGVGGERAEDYPASLAMMSAHAGRIPFDRAVTHRCRIEDAADAVELSQRPEAMKVVIDPGLVAG
jgi:threonine dehydrogenase-like Zn-dependent dehydrogenase